MAGQDQQYVKLPDGSYGAFPSSMKDEEITATIQKNFPTPLNEKSAQDYAENQAKQSLANIVQPVTDRLAPMGDKKPIEMEGTPPIVDIWNDIKGGEYAKGAHRAATALGRAYAPLALPAAFEAPIPFLGSLAGGVAGHYGLKHVAEMIGLSPDQADVAGDVGAALGGFGGGAAAGKFMPGGAKNEIASLSRYPATARQSQLGRPGTIRPVLPSMMQKYMIPDWAVPKGEFGTPTNPGPFMEIPARMPKAKVPMPELGTPENPGWVVKLPDRMPKPLPAPSPVDPVAEAVKNRTAAWLPPRMPKPAKPEIPPVQFGQGGTFSNDPNLPVREMPRVSTTPVPQVKFVTKFESPTKGRSLIQSPTSPAPNVRVTYQSVPQAELLGKVRSGDRQAILEWQRRGLELPENVGFLTEPGAGTTPWRRLKR